MPMCPIEMSTISVFVWRVYEEIPTLLSPHVEPLPHCACHSWLNCHRPSINNKYSSEIKSRLNWTLTVVMPLILWACNCAYRYILRRKRRKDRRYKKKRKNKDNMKNKERREYRRWQRKKKWTRRNKREVNTENTNKSEEEEVWERVEEDGRRTGGKRRTIME